MYLTVTAITNKKKPLKVKLKVKVKLDFLSNNFFVR